jgi:predicted transcriptional regulator
VGDALRDGIVAVEQDVLVRDVVALFVQKRLRLLVVVDGGGKVAGVVHESNVLAHIQAQAHPNNAPSDARFGWSRIAGVTAGDVMSSARCISETMSLRDALAEMAAARHQRLLAVDAEGFPVGILVDVHALRALRASSNDEG